MYDEMVEKAASMASTVTYGDPFDEGTTSAAIINPKQVDRVTGLIERAREEGARLVVGGDRPEGELAVGNFVNPTLFADVDNSMTIAREEAPSRPVLVAIPFSDEDEAVRIANDTDYGLGASVHTSDIKRALRVTKRVRAGTFGVNGYTVMPNAAFGGYKQSGIGRARAAAAKGYRRVPRDQDGHDRARGLARCDSAFDLEAGTASIELRCRRGGAQHPRRRSRWCLLRGRCRTPCGLRPGRDCLSHPDPCGSNRLYGAVGGELPEPPTSPTSQTPMPSGKGRSSARVSGGWGSPSVKTMRRTEPAFSPGPGRSPSVATIPMSA
ncbi:MAG: aldehyde dehydrogenase family protein [Acidimicrobiia bacterium]|nr:aldehyde dehydrogenase family protein [Acidimicrobiia bacterium]